MPDLSPEKINVVISEKLFDDERVWLVEYGLNRPTCKPTATEALVTAIQLFRLDKERNPSLTLDVTWLPITKTGEELAAVLQCFAFLVSELK